MEKQGLNMYVSALVNDIVEIVGITGSGFYGIIAIKGQISGAELKQGIRYAKTLRKC